MDITKFVYNSPSFLLETAIITYNEIFELDKNNSSETILNKKTMFISICAAAIEAHLNWYYCFEKEIDVNTSNKGRPMYTDKKISNSPLNSSTKGGVEAIFKMRNLIMHPKYEPRNASEQCLFSKGLILSFLGILINVSSELLSACPKTLKGRILVTEEQLNIANEAKNKKYVDVSGKNINWIELVKSGKVSLPIPSLGHIG